MGKLRPRGLRKLPKINHPPASLTQTGEGPIFPTGALRAPPSGAGRLPASNQDVPGLVSVPRADLTNHLNWYWRQNHTDSSLMTGDGDVPLILARRL